MSRRRAPYVMPLKKHDRPRIGSACPACRRKRARYFVRVRERGPDGLPVSAVVQDTCLRDRVADVFVVPLSATGYRVSAFVAQRTLARTGARTSPSKPRKGGGDARGRAAPRSARTREPRGLAT